MKLWKAPLSRGHSDPQRQMLSNIQSITQKSINTFDLVTLSSMFYKHFSETWWINCELTSRWSQLVASLVSDVHHKHTLVEVSWRQRNSMNWTWRPRPVSVSPSPQYLAKKLGFDTLWFGYLQTLVGLIQLCGGPMFGRWVGFKNTSAWRRRCWASERVLPVSRRQVRRPFRRTHSLDLGVRLHGGFLPAAGRRRPSRHAVRPQAAHRLHARPAR